jgi:signal transduction histidine kinase
LAHLSLSVLGFARDITDRKRAEERFEQQRERFLAMLNNFPEILYVADPETYEVLFVNERFKKMLGRDPVGTLCYEAFQGFEEPCQFCTNDIILKDKGQPYAWEYHNPILKQDYQITDQIIEWPDGREVRFEVAVNITDRKRAEDEQSALNEALARSNSELEQFAYVASHDLQEPLRVVTSYLQLLERRYKDDLGEDAKKYITRSVEASARMKRLINDLLLYSRVSTKGAPFEPTDCGEVLRQVLANLEIAIAENDAQVTYDDLPTVMADPGQMAQLFQNLINNAIKFRSEEPPEIHVDAERKDSGWQFAVRDNGIGIEPEYNERIFVIFQRLHTRREYAGTGIGLAVAKRIVERHGGRIWVESGPDEGSTFYFTILDREEETS